MTEFIPSRLRETILDRYPKQGQNYIFFLDEVVTDNAEAIAHGLLTPKASLDLARVTALDRIHHEAEENLPPLVGEAREVAQTFFNDSREWGALSESKGLILIYGSLLFGDPGKLDGDFLGVIDSIPPRFQEDQKDMTIRINDQLEDFWTQKKLGRAPKAGAHFFLLPLDYFRIPLRKKLKESPLRTEQSMEYLSIVFTGAPLFLDEKTRKRHQDFRQKAMMIVETDPLACTIVNFEIHQCLETRKERRKTSG
jgi:hypothetical protein